MRNNDWHSHYSQVADISDAYVIEHGGYSEDEVYCDRQDEEFHVLRLSTVIDRMKSTVIDRMKSSMFCLL
ncbi:hypothetical protein DPMN_016915 [Dreissena polymorpha]|uniref:Uncharacterized protein n=1 Tax=Dreissena polymorpha TaxID=45954 RepID=A0A9D4S7M0_DREPO|nr:hypothetical protein DPMN_016915 [Dreissena polymorpha]